MTRPTLRPALALAALAACSGEAPTPKRAAAPPPPAAAPGAPAPSPPSLRLPAAAAPTRAAVTLRLVPAESTIEGELELDLNFNEPTDLLWLNATEIEVREARLEAGGARVAARAVPGGDDFVGFAFARPAPKGPGRLHVAYRAKISDKDDRGVFRETERGKTYIFSQFENIEARRAFPCFDEPGFKIPWKVTLRVPEGDAAFSNTPVEREERGEGGLKTLHFAETKPLPAYLVAFAVGPFDVVDAGRSKRGVPVRVATPSGQQAEAAFAAKTTAALLDQLEAYFGVPYPYEKLDVVPIPRLASFGAMENAGLVTIGMDISLAKPEDESLRFRQAYTSIMAHELGHQWFGDLVTMAWWDDVWLNEAFATWVASKIAQRHRPEWKFDVRRAESASFSMAQDSLVTARKIRQEIKTKDDIQNAFDGITYEKGATVIGMFEQFVGEEPFRKGVQTYFARHAMKNATSAEFLADVSEGAGRDLRAAFSTFLDQPGVPLVSAALSCEGGAAKLALAQERYLPIGSGGDARGSTWQVPVCARWGKGKEGGEACGLLAGPRGELSLPAKGCPDWVMPKAKALGYYRVAYAPSDLDALLRRDRGLALVERVSVVEDARALVAAGKLPVAELLARAPELAKAPEPELLRAALYVAVTARPPDELRANYARFVDRAFSGRARAYGFRSRPNEAPEEKTLRPVLLGVATNRGENAALVAEAQRLALKWLDDPRAVEPDMVDAVLTAATAHGDRKLFERLRAEAKKATEARRRSDILDALSSFRDPAVLRDVYGLTLADEFDIRDTIWLLRYSNVHNEGAQWAFVKENFDRLFERLPAESRTTLVDVGNGFCDEARRADYAAFFKDRAATITGGPRRVAQTLENISLCVARRRAHDEGLAAFLKKY
ncbi:MAG TPA: M1 family metallopeptidase [Polyangiaceae bacterium]|nr:M1 family metallopeptidase [Polyangiaceae bacterium]